MKFLIYIIAILILYSCNSSPKYSLKGIEKLKILNSPTIVHEFNSDYPASVYMLGDSLLYATLEKSENCMKIINLKLQTSFDFGKIGLGDKEFLGLDFIHSVNIAKTLLVDNNKKKIWSLTCTNDSATVQEYIPYPNSIYVGSELNVSPNYIVGRKVGEGEKMFFIYNRQNGEKKDVEILSIVDFDFVDMNYTYAPVLAFNEKKQRIIAAFYFFDMYCVYDLSGKCISTHRISNNYLPSINKRYRSVDFNGDLSGCIRSFSTSEYCYLLRRCTNETKGDYVLLQLDWDGNIVNAYQLPNTVSGQFYIDSEQEKLYIIQQRLEGDEEIFSVVSYLLF